MRARTPVEAPTSAACRLALRARLLAAAARVLTVAVLLSAGLTPIARSSMATAPAGPPTNLPVDARRLPELSDGIDRCVRRLDRDIDIGYERIAARCPELVKLIEHGPWQAWLPRGWKETDNDLSAGGLKELGRVLQRENADKGAGARAPPDVARLAPMLQRLAGAGQPGLWSRITAWLRSILEEPPAPQPENWFVRLVSHVGLPQSIRQLLIYMALVAVIVFAAVIMANEIRSSGLLRHRGPPVRRHRSGPPPEQRPAVWSDVEKAPPAQRPRMALQLLVARLSEQQLLPPAGAMTVRELTANVRLTEAADRERLCALALLTEQVSYSHRRLAGAQIAGPVAEGKLLLDRLERPPAADSSP